MSVSDSNPNTFLPITKLIAPLRKIVERLPANLKTLPLGSLGAAIAAEHYGNSLIEIQPLFISLGALAFKSKGQPSTYMMRPSASRLVEETDLCSIPTEAPPLLRCPGVVEARRPETGERLWGDVVSLAWYEAAGPEREPPQLMPTIFLLGLRWPDGIFVARWQPAWTGEDLDMQLPAPDWGASLLDSLDAFEHYRLAKAAARFLVILGLLEQVENGPLNFEIDKTTRTRQVRPRDLSAKGFRPTPIQSQPLVQAPLDPATRVLGDTLVRGHLRLSRVGEGRSKIRWNYIHKHQSKRWFAPHYTVERDFTHPGLANDTLIFRGKP